MPEMKMCYLCDLDINSQERVKRFQRFATLVKCKSCKRVFPSAKKKEKNKPIKSITAEKSVMLKNCALIFAHHMERETIKRSASITASVLTSKHFLTQQNKNTWNALSKLKTFRWHFGCNVVEFAHHSQKRFRSRFTQQFQRSLFLCVCRKILEIASHRFDAIAPKSSK